MKKALVLLAEGFEETEAIATVDVMRRGGIVVTMASISGEYVCGANNIVVKSDAFLSECDEKEYDVVVLPGGFGGTMALAANNKVHTVLKQFLETKRYIAAICAAPYVLDKAGVLSGNYTCYPGMQEQITHGIYIDTHHVIVEDRIITSRGPATALCFGLCIVAELVGREMADSVRDGMLASFCDK